MVIARGLGAGPNAQQQLVEALQTVVARELNERLDARLSAGLGKRG